MKKLLPLFLTLALLLSLAGSARFGVAAAEDTAAEPEASAQTEESEAPAQTEEPEMPAQTVEQLDPPEEPAQTEEPEEASAMPWDAYVSLSEERLSVSTEELIDLIQESRCLESAAMYRMSDNDEVYGRLRERFNILAELETRPDAPLSLLKRYCKPGDNMFTLLDTSFYWNRLNETEQVIFARVYEAKTGRTYPRYEGGPVPEGLPEENDYLILPDGRLSRPGAKTVWEDGKIKFLPRGDDIIFVFTVEVETPAAHTELTDEQLHAPTGELVDALLTLEVVREMHGLYASVPWMDAEYHYAIAQALVPGIRELETRPDAASVLLRKLRDRLKPGELSEALCLKNLLSVEPYSSMLTQAEAAQYAQLVQTVAETFYVSVDDAASDADVYDADEPVEPNYVQDVPTTFNANGFTYDRSSTNTRTTNGTIVPLYTARGDHSYADRQRLDAEIVQMFGVELLGSATSKYNCHSYAWYQKSVQNPSWILHVDRYYEDTHARRTEVPSAGDIVVYYGSDGYPLHSAVVKNVSSSGIVCESKWGARGLYEHLHTNVPPGYRLYTGGPVSCEFYTYLRAHNYVATVIDTAYHRLTCKFCDLNVTEAHTADPRTGKCITCGSVVSSTIFRAVLPESPDTEHCEHHR